MPIDYMRKKNKMLNKNYRFSSLSLPHMDHKSKAKNVHYLKSRAYLLMELGPSSTALSAIVV